MMRGCRGCVHQWGQPRSAALYYDYVETFPRVRGNKKGALPQAVNAPDAPRYQEAQYNL
jgi:hypothetical protein